MVRVVCWSLCVLRAPFQADRALAGRSASVHLRRVTGQPLKPKGGASTPSGCQAKNAKRRQSHSKPQARPQREDERQDAEHRRITRRAITSWASTTAKETLQQEASWRRSKAAPNEESRTGRAPVTACEETHPPRIATTHSSRTASAHAPRCSRTEAQRRVPDPACSTTGDHPQGSTQNARACICSG